MHILLVDDHPLLCEALADYLSREDQNFSNKPIHVTPVFSLDDAINEVCSNPSPDLTLLDLNLGGDDQGTKTLERFQQNNPHKVPVAVFTGLSLNDPGSASILRQCIENLGAIGILMKESDIKTMFTGLTRILAGEFWLPQEVFTTLISTSSSPKLSSAPANYHLGLSPREWTVAECLARGLRNKQIAKELHLSEGHIRQVLYMIYDKLGLNRIETAIAVNNAIKNSNANI